LLPHAIAEKVLFVPGTAFFAENADEASLRLSFAAPAVTAIEEGVARLARAMDATAKTAG
jgi:DNA-binding transcriptional MocR family regulator